MNRNFVLLSAAALLGACASTNTSAGTMEPQTVSTTSSTTVSTTSTTGERREGREGRRGMMDPMRMEQMMLRDISLSADQKVKLDSLHARHQAEMDQMRARGDSMPMMDRDHMRMMMDQHVTEVRAILTPDQQVIFDRNVNEMRTRMQQGGRRGTPPRI